MLIRSGGRVPKAVELAKRLKELDAVKEAYAVFGRYDVVAFFECEDVKHIFRSLSRATEASGIIVSESLIEVQQNQYTEEYGKGPFAS
jgi:uncharacterized protein with GYD domain